MNGGEERFLLGCFTRPFAEFPLEEAFTYIAEAGYRYAGLMAQHQKVPTLPSAGGPRSAEEMRRLAESVGLTLTTIITGQPGGLVAAQRWVDDCQALGIYHIILINPWPYSQGLEVRRPERELRPEEEAFFELMHELADYAQPKGVTLAIKPHTGSTATSQELRETLASIDHPNVGVYYDPGNVSFYEGVRPEDDLPHIAKRVIGLCIKDHRGPRAHPDFPLPGEGEVNWRSIFQTLKGAGFRGPCLLENFTVQGSEAAKVAIRKTRDYLGKVLAELS